MMRPTWAIAAAALALAACGGKDLNDAGSGTADASTPAGMGGAPGMGGEPGAGGDPGVGGEPGAGGAPGAGGEPGMGGAPVVPYPGGCTADADCSGGAVCRLGICATQPPMDPGLFSCMDQVIPGSTPALDCWDTPPPRGDGPAEVPARGLLEFFGDGTKPVGLTVRFYDFATFDPTGCADEGADQQDVIDARRAVEDCLDGAHAPLAETVTADCPESNAESACWSVDALPTHTQLVVRITGDDQLWVPTYTYGLYINPCDNGHPRTTSGTCPSDVTDSPDGVEWGCDLQGGDAPFFYRDLTVISQATWISFPPTAGVARLELGNGAVAGRQYDCHGQSVVNAAASFARAGTPIYFNGNPADVLPQPGRVQTNARGTYASLNVPAGPNGMVSVAWQGGELKVVGYQRFFQLPNTIVMINPNGRKPVAIEPPY